mgnify:CR=1 FL=1
MRLNRSTWRLVWVGIGSFLAGFFSRGVQLAYPETHIAQFISILRYIIMFIGVLLLIFYAFIVVRRLVRNREIV